METSTNVNDYHFTRLPVKVVSFQKLQNVSPGKSYRYGLVELVGQGKVCNRVNVLAYNKTAHAIKHLMRPGKYFYISGFINGDSSRKTKLAVAKLQIVFFEEILQEDLAELRKV